MNSQIASADVAVNTLNGFTFALWLAIITIVYNLLEGLVSVWFASADETLALFGFGVDSFIETISAAGILAMILRIKNNTDVHRDKFEVTALKITGWGFYVLSVGLISAALISLLKNHQPDTTIPGLVISFISIASMWLLVHFKRKVGHNLNSAAIVADANCNLVCIYMSVVLLISSILYSVSGFGGFDALGAAALVWFSVKEGRESFAKARGKVCCCND